MKKLILFVVVASAVAAPAYAEDILTVRQIGMELARDIANQAVLECRHRGYQVSAVVVDRNGNLRAALRDDLAPRFTTEIAEDKANASIMSGLPSGEFRDNRPDIRMEMDHVHGVLMMQGGLPINAAGQRIGAIGVSGAPGGDKDEACARAALAKFDERINFAD